MKVVLSAVGYNLRLILARLAKIPGGIFFLFACLVVFFRRIAVAATLQPARTG